jgi:DNA mismatch endonuclease, patch repair protein
MEGTGRSRDEAIVLSPEASASWASSPRARRVMQGNRSRDTKPELRVRTNLHAAGMRFRVDYRPIPSVRRSADIVFTRVRLAVFIDGCYWHGCPLHARPSGPNLAYWSEKIERNRQRDVETSALFLANGWAVLRFWEHEDARGVADDIARHYRKLSG